MNPQVRELLDHLKALLRWLGPDPARPRPQGAGEWLRALWRGLLPGGNMPPLGRSDGRLASLADHYPLPTWRPLARLTMAAVALFVVWANVARLDEVAIAEGEVVPEGKVKVIQHLEGGVIRDITVTEGQEVKEGTPLLQLDLSAVAMNREELQVRLDGLVLQAARLRAELSGAAQVVFPEAESARQPTLMRAEQRNFDARRQANRSNMTVLQDQARQKMLEVEELETRQRALAGSLRLARQRLAMSTDLMKSGLTAKMEHVQLESQVEDLEGQIESVRAGIPRAQAAATEAKSRIELEQANLARAT
ncbi:MAG: HlyD family type I secretion periplasmic adaptor subunit, partial [Magnetospirillum sp.]|nr:HlyD family type I secretion periplasmic adaptor subunit [Magnetospirillum sp.]